MNDRKELKPGATFRQTVTIMKTWRGIPTEIKVNGVSYVLKELQRQKKTAP